MAKKPSITGPGGVYIATRAVNHDHTLYQEGEEIELNAEQAAQLLDVGAVVEKPAKTEKAQAS